MGLLHSLKGEQLLGTLWELGQLAEEVGIPLPPPLARIGQALPALAGAIGSGDPQALLSVLGPTVAEALGAELQNPTLQALIRGDLEGARDSLAGYLGNLEGLKSGLLDQLMEATGTAGALGQAQDLLSGLRGLIGQADGALGDLLNGPPTGTVLGLIAQASPELAAVLSFAEGALDTVQGQLSGIEGRLGSLRGQLDDLTRLESLAGRALNELDERIDGLDGLFGAVRSLLP